MKSLPPLYTGTMTEINICGGDDQDHLQSSLSCRASFRRGIDQGYRQGLGACTYGRSAFGDAAVCGGGCRGIEKAAVSLDKLGEGVWGGVRGEAFASLPDWRNGERGQNGTVNLLMKSPWK